MLDSDRRLAAVASAPPQPRIVLRYLPAFRVLRIGLATARALPRYWMLLARDHYAADPPPQESWDRAHRAAADRIHDLALNLQGALIKAAQIGGARADIFPRPFIERLSRFHDDVPPRPLDALIPSIETSLGSRVGEVFTDIDTRALGAASLAQVHRARLRDGSDVVIKIQYPEARRIIPVDLRMMRGVAGLVQRMQGSLDLRSVINEITRFIEMELDFRREAESTMRLGAILSRRSDVRVPRIYPEYTRDRLLVMEYLEGIQVTQTNALRAAGHSLGDVARRIGDLYGAMLFEYGFFHGDPHPGNLLVLQDGRIGLLDFGLCKELPPMFARLVAQLMVAALIGDSDAALAAAAELGFDVTSLDANQLRALMLTVIGDSDGDANLATVLGSVQIRRIPDDFGLVLRTMLLLNGLSYRLAPGRRLVQGELIKHLAIGAKGAPTG